jgi:phosphinothricin acetyltransferase
MPPIDIIALSDAGDARTIQLMTVNVRLARAADAARIAEIYAPSITLGATSFELEPPAATVMAERIAQVLAFAPWLVGLDGDDRVIGYAYASPHHERAAYRWSVNVAIYIDAAHHRRGVGRRLYESLFALLRVQGFYLAHAGITLPNASSVGLHEALGFRPVGIYRNVGWKLGAWRDVGWWQLELQERPAIPNAPLSPDEASELPAWRAALGG